MNPLQKHFLRRIAALRGARNLAVQMRTASASALRAPCTSSTVSNTCQLRWLSDAYQFVLTNTFSKDSSCVSQLKP